MSTAPPPTAQELAGPVGEPNTNLARWLTDARTAEFFGKAWKLKADALAAVITGGNLAEVAREHGVTAEAAYKYARRAKAIFPTLHTKKLTAPQG